ncbi:MAG: tripartite tricarboxylate transporter substrate-binding protein [Beijerinckiaceae bacterium]|nr:tripartite tricarboxylate transporter substrate-binding protein [Beijerinckiaceae bacterium]
MRGLSRVALRASVLLSFFSFPLATFATALGVEDFYRGKQGRFVIHSTPGGAYDGWARLIVPYLTKYVPGAPIFVPQNMPGAGGLVAANYMFARAPKDGSVIGMVGRNIPSDALMKAGSVGFDPRQFNWIGNPEFGATVSIVSSQAQVKVASDLFEKEVLVGGAGAGSAVSTMPMVIRNLLGMKFKLVEGYGSQSAITLAIERGEVHGTFATLTSVLTSFPGAVESGKIRILFNLERKPVPGLNAPSIFDFAKTEEQKQVLNLLSVSSEVGRPMLAPPGVPRERVEALRRAFDQAMKDPQLQADATKMRLPVANVVSGSELEAIIADLMATPPAVVERMNALLKQ